MNKQEHDQFIYDNIQELLRKQKELDATPAPKPVLKNKGIFKNFLDKVLVYFTT